MQFSAAQIATLIQGRVVGNPDALARNIARIEEAGTGDLSFVGDPRYLDYLADTPASIIIISESLTGPETAATQIVVSNARSAFTILLEQYSAILAGSKSRSGIEQPSYIHESAKVGEGVYVGAFAYIGAEAALGAGAQVFPGCYIGQGAHIGEGAVLHPGVRVYDGCRIGARVVIHAGTVIGADGFGFTPEADNSSYKKMPQLGNVVIEDDVEIGANTTIDRAMLGSTIIRRGVKLDNLIQIGHNAEVGEHTVIAAQTGIAGSTRVGRHCIIGGQVGVVGHIAIADRVSINAQSGIGGNVTEEGVKLTGSPAADYRASLKSQVIFRNLPAIETRLREAERKLEEVTRLLAEKVREG